MYGHRFYLAQLLDEQADLRELVYFPSKYVSAGQGASYKAARWIVDSEGRLESIDEATGETRRLAAHRTWISDIAGPFSTRAITTTYKGHENSWQLQRVGDLNQPIYTLALRNNRCIKDYVDHVGWMLRFPSQ